MNDSYVSLQGVAPETSIPPRLLNLLRHTGKTPVICLIAFMVSCALGLINLGIIFYSRETLLAAPAIIGWVAVSWLPGYVAGCLIIEPRLRHRPPRQPVLWSALSMGFLFWIMCFTTSIPLLIFLGLCYGLLLSLFWPFLMGWLSFGHEGDSLGRTMAIYNLSWCSANIISPFLCGWLSEYHTRLPLGIGGGLAIGAALVLSSASRGLPRIREDQAHLPAAPDPAGMPSSGRRTPLRFAAWIGLLTTCFGTGIILAIFPLAAREDLNLSMFMIGNLLLVRAVFQTIGFIMLGRTSRWHFRAMPMMIGHVLGIAGVLLLMIVVHPGLIALALCAYGLATAISFVYSMFHGVSGHEKRSQAMAIHEVLLATGLGLGGIAGGALYQLAGIRWVYALCAVLIIAGLPVQAIIARTAARRQA